MLLVRGTSALNHSSCQKTKKFLCAIVSKRCVVAALHWISMLKTLRASSWNGLLGVDVRHDWPLK